MDITKLGWTFVNGFLEAVVGITQMAPPELMKVVACGCIVDKACSRNTHSCKSAVLSCTSHCKCLDQEKCYNPYKKNKKEMKTQMEVMQKRLKWNNVMISVTKM